MAEVDAETGLLRAELAPDQAANAALIAGVAQQRGLPARAVTIALATAIQESGLRNIDYGDRDSLGLFQQRPSQGWGTDAQVQDPLYSTNAFYDVLVEIEGYQSLAVTDAAQQVQRSGFPDAYADHEGEARALASALTGLAPASLTCSLRPLPEPDDTTDPVLARLADERATALVGALQAWGPPGWQPGPVVETTGPTAALSGPGTVELTLDAVGSADPARTAWALAHATVAIARDNGVVRIEVDGRAWSRGGDGWQVVEDPTADTGTVLVSVGGSATDSG